ncbi:MAG: alpha/beta fold hydrolase [Pyrinomonadaceae bacterium]|nr:alpha/beta fold hydrolase [Pyrinomonadaceae bacterium]
MANNPTDFYHERGQFTPTAVGTSIGLSWITSAKLQPQAPLRLFCFPYAGGAASVFSKVLNGLPSEIEVCPVELPGRGSRLSEPPVNDLESLVEIIAEELAPHLDQPFAFFGHSMGALLGFELARYLRRARRVEPVHLLVSAGRAPQVRASGPVTWDLQDDQLVDKMRRLNGTPQAVLDNPELMALVLPIIRADLVAIDSYVYRHEPPLSCPITALGGLQDSSVTRDELCPWREQTSESFTLRMLPGDHFFLHSAQQTLREVVARELRQYCSTRPTPRDVIADRQAIGSSI